MYRQQKQSLEQIAKDHNCGRKAVRTLLSNYNIPIWTKAELVMNRVPSPPNDVRQVLKTMSMSQAAVHYNVGRSTIRLWCKELGIGSDYFKYAIDKVSLQERLRTQTPLQIAESLSWPLEVVLQKIKYHKLEICSEVLPYKETCQRCISIAANQWDNPGYVKTIKHGDPPLYSSVLHHTASHQITTNKFTERVFRLVRGMKPQDTVNCLGCKVPLKFYTMRQGYGFNDDKTRLYCRSCYPLSQYFSGSSRASQLLFDRICEVLDNEIADECWYKTKNQEKRLNITAEHGGNCHCYLMDFVVRNINIEFDGVYWHQHRGNKDSIRDAYVRSRGYSVLRITDQEWYAEPDVVVDRCVKFIMENMTNVVAA